MKYGIHDAKNNLSRLVHEVAETGISVTITSHGEDLVEVVPMPRKPMDRKEALARILAGGVGADLTRAEVVSLVEEGRP